MSTVPAVVPSALTVKVDAATYAAVRLRCVAHGLTIGEWLTEAIRVALEKPPDAPLTPEQIMAKQTERLRRRRVGQALTKAREARRLGYPAGDAK